MNLKEERPWGNYEVVCNENGAKAKRIEIHSGKRLSLQKHFRRAEKWIVLSGRGLVTVGNRSWEVREGSFVEIGVGEIHRMHNAGAAPLVFFEVQIGDYLGEDDIVRIEDDFGRIPAESAAA